MLFCTAVYLLDCVEVMGETAVTLQSISANSSTAVIPILIATLLLALMGGVALRRRSGRSSF